MAAFSRGEAIRKYLSHGMPVALALGMQAIVKSCALVATLGLLSSVGCGSDRQTSMCIDAIANGKDCKDSCNYPVPDTTQLKSIGTIASGSSAADYRSQSEPVSSVKQAIDTKLAFDPGLRNKREVVRLELRRADGTVVRTATGVVVAPHLVMTVAHLYDRDVAYAGAVVIARDRQGTEVPLPEVDWFVNPDHRPMIGTTYDMANGPRDFAFVAVADDFADLDIRPATLTANWLPASDCVIPPLTQVELYGYGARGTVDSLRGVVGSVMNSNAQIEARNVITFQGATEGGDSGGPVIYTDLRTARTYVVGMIVASATDGSASFASRITVANMEALANQIEAFRVRSEGHLFPVPAPTLPNGAVNPTSVHYPLTTSVATATSSPPPTPTTSPAEVGYTLTATPLHPPSGVGYIAGLNTSYVLWLGGGSGP